MKNFHKTTLIFLVLLLAGCGSQHPTGYVAPQQISEPKIEQESEEYEVQTERINNCDGANPTYVVSYKTIETQRASFEVSVGAGGLVSGTPIPQALEVQLEAKITAALAKDYSITAEKGHDITLENPAGTYWEHKITWKVTRIKGLIEVIYGDGVAHVIFDKIADVELYNRESTPLEDCSEPSIVTTINTPLPVVVDTPSAPLLAGNLLHECNFDTACGWIIETGNGLKDGSLRIAPGYDAVLEGSGKYSDFNLTAGFIPPPSGSMAFYLRHQRPACVDWNCSIQIVIYPDQVIARRFMGASASDQFEIARSGSISLRSSDWNTILISAQGSDFKVFLNDELVLEFNDNTYLSGSFVIDNAPESTDIIQIDYLRVYELK